MTGGADLFSLEFGVNTIEKTPGTSLNCSTAKHGDWVYDGAYVHTASKNPVITKTCLFKYTEMRQFKRVPTIYVFEQK